MIELKRINNTNEEVLKPLIDLYKSAFPPIERRNIDQLKEYIGNKEKMFFCSITDDKEPAGILVYWLFDEFFYLEHLAVFPEMRNRKIGQQVLEHLDTLVFVPQLLEAEPAEDELSQRRIGFYRRNGFEVATTDYVQPPYPFRESEGCPLWIMSKPSLGKEELQKYIKQIKKEVYNCK